MAILTRFFQELRQYFLQDCLQGKKILVSFTTLLVLFDSPIVFAQNTGFEPSLEQVIWRQGLQGEVIYNKKDPQNLGIGTPRQLAIDPTTGDIYIGQLTVSGGNILVIDPNDSSAHTINFFSSGLAFSADGNTLYFGVSTLMLGAWFKQQDIYRKFAIIPAIETVQVTPNGTLYVATSDFGPKGLYPNSVIKVDTSNAHFEPAFTLQQASKALGVTMNTLNAMAIDGIGNIYIGDNQGRIVIQKTDGSFIEGNSRPITLGGINNAGLGSSSDGLVYHYDGAAGEVFAYSAEGERILLAYGEQLTADKLSGTGVASDGKTLYIVSDQAELIRVTATNGANLLDVISNSLGDSSIRGVVIDELSQQPLSGAKISLHNGSTTTSDSSGFFAFNLAVGLYEVSITHEDFLRKIINIDVKNQTGENFTIALQSALPSWLAAGISAEIIANNKNNDISGATDVDLDTEGNLWAINHNNASITKTLLDPITRAVIDTFTFAQGGSMANAWFIVSDDNLNVFTSTSNAGVLKLPPLENEQPWFLNNDSNSPNKVIDQLGVNRMDSLITDVDGGAKLSNGDIVLVSGAGGSILPNLPEGTFDSLIRQTPSGEQSIISRGLDVQGQEIFENPDITKIDAQDRLLVSNRNGNLVRVNAGNGIAELIWPGDGDGKSESLSAYTTINDDGDGYLFVRGASTVVGGNRLSMISPDGQNLLLLAGGLSSDYGGFVFDDNGRSVIVSDWDVLLRLSTNDGRTIAENLLTVPVSNQRLESYHKTKALTEQPTQAKALQNNNEQTIRTIVWQPQRFENIVYNPDDFNNNVPKYWAAAVNEANSEPQAPQNNGGSVWYLVALLMNSLFFHWRTKRFGKK
ncbi:MAG: hypothetical protein COB83_10220 [Gammaproteobacteria bacterium]|nr:MAG: hypothetical protein COB83_10220 [Gammaproteobacteria bacterium]